MISIGTRIPGAIGRDIPLSEFAQWCQQNGFVAIDLNSAKADDVTTVRSAGLRVGTVDLSGTSGLLSPESSIREQAIATCITNLQAIQAMGVQTAFTVFIPPDTRQSRRESFDYWQESFPVVVAEAEALGIRIVVEGWPGPNHSALGVTPETLRAMFAAVPSPNFGINYDPSHLVRAGVDYKRFLEEFIGRVLHAHGKDTIIDEEGRYRYGTLGTTFDAAPGFGSGDWRYTIPGEGSISWAFIVARLQRAGFDGIISLELEDFRYNGTVDGEKQGLLRARQHLGLYL